ncbi:hypothetical protein GC194_00250 [bacterium]|nr:hypothetical protein [bacterium]
MYKPSPAFIGASWLAFAIGFCGFLIGLWNANLALSEKGFYFVLLILGLFSAISIQKAVRDKLEGIPVTDVYFGVCWFSTLLSLVLLTVGLWNADLWLSEKGFYAFGFVLSLFGVIAIQKNIRDKMSADEPPAQKNKIEFDDDLL